MDQVADLKPSGASKAAAETDFAELLRPLIGPALRLAMAMLHDANAAEDAVQEASFTAWAKLARVRDPNRLRPWFMGVVANKCRNARRSRWSSAVEFGVPEHLSIASNEEGTLRGADLRRAVANLAYDDRVVVVLFFYLDMPIEEVAAAVKRSVGATRARLYRSIKRLRPDLDNEEALR